MNIKGLEECQICLECKEWCEPELLEPENEDSEVVSNCCSALCTNY